ncbi:MAG: DUF192 domain-containing protein [Patescibacteria group bacterium]
MKKNFINPSNKYVEEVVINNKSVKVEIADEESEQYNGLSGRESLCANCGMLFIFNNKTTRTFVMRRMDFPLDIIWLDDNKIIKIDKNLKPEGDEPINFYQSSQPVNYVLEVNAGLADKYNMVVGNIVEYK